MKILAIQNRMGIGDTVIFLPFIKALSKKFNTPISILVKKSSKADQYLHQTDYVDKILFLDEEKKENGNHNSLIENLRLIKNIKKYDFEKIFIFNSSLRYNLIARLSKITEIYQYPLFKKANQHITDTPKKFLKDQLNLDVNDDPDIGIDNILISNSAKKFQINQNEINILLGVGGSGPTKRIPTHVFLKVIEEISKKKKCKFFLATGKDPDEQVILNEILQSRFGKLCIPLDNLSIKETLPVIKNCNLSICNDTSFSHLSAALKIKTITLMADTPLIYGSYSSKMYPIIPDGVETVSHNTLGKDRINPQKILSKLNEIIN